MKSSNIVLCMFLLIAVLSSCQTNLGNISMNDRTSDDSHEAEDLIDLGIVTEEELNEDIYITNLRALQVIHRAIGLNDIGEVDDTEISKWYSEDALAPLDYIDDAYKKLFLDLSWWGSNRNPILTNDDILKIKLNDNINNYKALVFITRMVGDTYDCTDYPEELDFTEKSQTYEAALQKGIIDDYDVKNADLPILSKDFYEIIHKAIFVEMEIGGEVPTKDRYIDIISAKNERNSQPEDEDIPHAKEIPVKATINNDMSISWIIPNKYKNYINEDVLTTFSTITNDGITEEQMISTGIRTDIDTASLIKFIAGNYPAKLDYIRCTYNTHDYDYQTNDELFFDIDISTINVIIAGEEINPGVYTRFKGQWVPKRISLADGQLFNENSYYLLTSYEHKYREPKFNSISRAIFKMTKTSNAFDNSGSSANLKVGGVYLEDIHIQEITIKYTASPYFTLYITPESKEAFTVEEVLK